MAQIAFASVGKVYADGTRAVGDLTLDIQDGEFCVFVGPSGCGKTTALRMVAGLEEITEGTVTIGDRVVNGLPAKDRDIAMVFQSYALYPHMSVFDNMAFGLKLRKLPKTEIRTRVERAAATLGLTEHLGRRPRALSGGQRQRVAMGRAIVREPAAFLMDEPLSNLDAKLRVQMRAEIAGLQRDLNVTTIYVTHDQIEAMTMGDRVAVIRRGQLQQVAPPQELYDKPVNVFVAGFIGSPSMNLLDGAVRVTGDRAEVQVGSATLPMEAASEAIRSWAGRQVVVGIRPEDLDDPALAAQQGATLRGRVVLREPLGAEVLVHAEIDAKPAVTQDVRELAKDLDESAEAGLQRQAATLVCRFGPRTKVREGDVIDIACDTRSIHVFDPETGHAVPSR